MSVDPLRHLSVFSPTAFGNRRVDIIGAGATGSRIVLSLAKLGVENLHVWDFDKVEEHNVANQAFGNGDIGKLKVEALAELVKQQTGADIFIHPERVDGTQTLGNVVFLLTDTMASRKEIWEKGLRYKFQVSLVVETRMGADSMRVYAINPSDPSHIREWEKTLCADDVAEVSACGASITVGPTAETLSGLAVWQFIRWFSVFLGKKDDVLEHEIIMALRPSVLLTRRF